MKPRYSGKKSTKFWKQVKGLYSPGYEEMYSLGCALQNLEEYVLGRLKAARRDYGKG
jgi:hypothetical protein